MHITILAREAGWLGGGSRGGEVVKLYYFLQTELLWTSMSRITLRSKFGLLSEMRKSRNMTEWETQELTAMWVVSEIMIYCLFLHLITLFLISEVLNRCQLTYSEIEIKCNEPSGRKRGDGAHWDPVMLGVYVGEGLELWMWWNDRQGLAGRRCHWKVSWSLELSWHSNTASQPCCSPSSREVGGGGRGVCIGSLVIAVENDDTMKRD